MGLEGGSGDGVLGVLEEVEGAEEGEEGEGMGVVTVEERGVLQSTREYISYIVASGIEMT